MPPEVIAGVDEAGRGALAGAVYAAAVILDPARPITGLNDSKKLSARRREQLFDQIRDQAAAWAIATASPAEIDQLNILQASLLAMSRAVDQLAPSPSRCLVDGNRLPPWNHQAQAVVGGDALHPEIMAASILAKVARDAAMCELAQQFPQFGFDGHKGYPTADHRARLAQHGPCPEHRRSFAPVAQCVLALGS